MKRLVGPLAILVLATSGQSCLTATAIHVSVYSDVPCSANAPVEVVLGSSASDLAAQLGQATTSTSKTGCTTPGSPGYVGDFVLTPETSHDEPLAFAVMTRTDGQPADRCGDPTLSQAERNECIVSKRSLRFTSHETTSVRIDLRISCVGVTCTPDQTCLEGVCVSAACVGTDCSESALFNAAHASPSLAPHAFANPGTVVTSPTGLAQQEHLIYAENDQRYWFFYIDADSPQIKTRVSTDLANWSDGGIISLGAGTSGSNAANFSVAYANESGLDVVELVVDEPSGATGYTFHVRTTLAGPPGAEQPTAAVSAQDIPNGIGSNNCQPDGPVTVIGSDRHVYDATGWQFDPTKNTHCDMDVYESSIPETGGGTFNASFSQTGYFVTLAYTTAHQLIPFGSNPNLLGVWLDNLDADGKAFDAIAWTNFVVGYKGGDGGGFAGGQVIAGYLFDNKKTVEIYTDDWSLCRVSDTEIHAVAHTTDPTNATPKVFEQAVFDGTKWTNETPPPPLQSAIVNSGVVVLSDTNPAHGMLVVVLGADGSTLSYSHWTPPSNGNSASWSAWTSFPGTAPRRWLAGTGCVSAHPALLWTEGADPGPYQIMGTDVSTLLQ